MKFSTKAKAVALAALIVVSTAQPAHAVDLTGSGASFVDPLLQACKAGFAKASGHSYVYSSVGSGTGKRNSDSQLGDFWFSDSTHSASTKRSTVFHAPIIAAPIAVLVNLPAKKDIYLSTATVAKIFAGEITKWNDAAIVADNNRSITTTIYRKDSNGNVKKDSKGNPVVLRTATKTSYYTLPNQLIKVVFRADGSGTTNNFTKWLKWCCSNRLD
jgi:phosphate transport system substrate-binding protein